MPVNFLRELDVMNGEPCSDCSQPVSAAAVAVLSYIISGVEGMDAERLRAGVTGRTERMRARAPASGVSRRVFTLSQ